MIGNFTEEEYNDLKTLVQTIKDFIILCETKFSVS